jgi:hypothetical protein
LIRKCSTLCSYSYGGFKSFKGYTVVTYSEANSRYHPNWYLVQDANKDYFLTIRGSISADDWLTDFEFDEVTKVISGYSINFHSGFYKAASNVYRKVESYMKNSKGKFYITGHSYGAAVATIICTLAKLNSQVSSKVNGAICFAAAPSMSYCPQVAYNYIATIVNDDDIVPTMSVKNAYNLVKPALTIGTPTVVGVTALLKGATKVLEVASPNQFSKDLFKNLGASYDNLAKNIIKFHNTPSVYKVRYVSGTTYHLKKNKKYLKDCIVSQANTFNSVSLTFTSCTNHDLKNYDAKLKNIIS